MSVHSPRESISDCSYGSNANAAGAAHGHENKRIVTSQRSSAIDFASYVCARGFALAFNLL